MTALDSAASVQSTLCLKVGSVSLSQIGQRLTCVSAQGGLRYFNLEQA